MNTKQQRIKLVNKLYESDFNFSDTESLLDDLDKLNPTTIKSLEDKKNKSEKELVAITNYYLLKYGYLRNNQEDVNSHENVKTCQEKMRAMSEKTNHFVNSSDPERYEVQREKYIPAAKKLCIFTLASMRGGINEENLKWAEMIFQDYESMYSIFDEKGNLARAYHFITHPILQIMLQDAVNMILRIHKEMSKDSAVEENIDKVVSNMITDNPELAHMIYHSMIHDLVQPYGIGWQNKAMTNLKDKDKIKSLDILVKGNQELMREYGLDKCGFGKNNNKDFILLAAKIFFPGQDGNYDKNKTFAGFEKGGAEFLSVVYAYNKETSEGKEISLLQQIRMCISLAATIPFNTNDVFFKNSFEKVKFLVQNFTTDQKLEIIKEFDNEQSFASKKNRTEEQKLNYIVSKIFSEACKLGNNDVVNFATKDDILQTYWGSNGVFTEVFGLKKYLFENEPKDRIPALIVAVTDKRSGGFSYKNADQKVIYHYFECDDFPELNCSSLKEAENMHQLVIDNFAKGMRLHEFDLIDAVIQSFDPRYSLDEKKLIEMNDELRSDIVETIITFNSNKKLNSDDLKTSVFEKCKNFITESNTRKCPVGVAFFIEQKHNEEKHNLQKKQPRSDLTNKPRNVKAFLINRTVSIIKG